MPVPVLTLAQSANGDGTGFDFREFSVVPVGFAGFSEALAAGNRVYVELGNIFSEKMIIFNRDASGAYLPQINGDEPLMTLILAAIERAGYSAKNMMIAVNASADLGHISEGDYFFKKRQRYMSTDDLADYYCRVAVNFPLLLLQNPFAPSDFYGYKELHSRLGAKILISGDRLVNTNSPESLKGQANTLKITFGHKYTAIRSLSEEAKAASFRTVFSAEDDAGPGDTTICDLSVAIGADFFAGGAPFGGENILRYNRMLRIESALKSSGELAPPDMPLFFSEQVYRV